MSETTKTDLKPFTADDLSMDMGAEYGGVYPFVEDENANVTGHGHQDKAAFAEAINTYDRAMNPGGFADDERWFASDISHQWAVRNTEETCTVYVDSDRDRPITPETPGAFPITTLWNYR